MSKPELPGVQARLWCAYSGEAPLPAAGDATDTNGTVAAGGSPAGSPTAEKWEIQEGTPPTAGPGQQVSDCVSICVGFWIPVVVVVVLKRLQ